MDTVYTDGAYSRQSDFGGWAWAISLRRFQSGAERGTTNNRMEMTAVLEALLAMPDRRALTIVSDSQYVVNAFNDSWLIKWKGNGWRTGAGKPVQNQDLWRQLDTALKPKRSVKFKWVKGHGDDPMNQFVDKLAVCARMRQAGWIWKEHQGWVKEHA